MSSVSPIRASVDVETPLLDASETEINMGGHGGGGSNIGLMEGRLSAVEKSIQHIEKSLDRIEGGVSVWKWQLLAAAVAVVLAVYGGNYAVQQMTVSTFQAAAQQAQQPVAPPAPPPNIIINVPAAQTAPAAKSK